MTDSVTVIGAGPAGLTAAYELVRLGVQPIVLEKADKVGGIARTEYHNGYRFDIGGHRFFTKDQEVNKLWHEALGGDFRLVKRLSRIAYHGRFFNYPLDVTGTLTTLGALESVRILASYLRSQVLPCPEENTFEEWITNRFGRRLYEVFFKTYTEKVWGIPCSEIRSDWAAQRIKGLSLRAAVLNALLGNNETKSLIDEFHYPVLGPGMMWERFGQTIEEAGGEILLDTEAVSLVRSEHRIEKVVAHRDQRTIELAGGSVISSMPLPELIARLDPPPPAEISEAAANLRYRSFVIVGIVVDQRDLFPDNWIYLHSPEVKAGRIQNIKNWSPAMVPDPDQTSLGIEYFCDEGDETWSMPDSELIAMASAELAVLGLAEPTDVVDGVVFRQPKAYPVYDSTYKKQRDVIREFLQTIDNLQTIGRNGTHRYNNMDHSMRTGLLAARNVLGATHDIWEVNEEETYLEEERRARLEVAVPDEVLTQAFARLDALALGLAVGTATGLALFLATVWLILRNRGMAGPYLGLLSQYFPGYGVNVRGALVGFGYAGLCGFLFGWSLATLRNLLLSLYIYSVGRRAEWRSLRDFLDHS